MKIITIILATLLFVSTLGCQTSFTSTCCDICKVKSCNCHGKANNCVCHEENCVCQLLTFFASFLIMMQSGTNCPT